MEHKTFSNLIFWFLGIYIGSELLTGGMNDDMYMIFGMGMIALLVWSAIKFRKLN